MRALDGVRVLDLSSFIAGPFAAAILAEHGAEVIKVEHPDGGEAGRRFGTATEIPDLSLSFQNDNRNKRSVTLDLKTEEDQARLRALAARFRERALLEASGGVTLENVRALAETGVHRISVGALTHSAPSADLALEIRPGGVRA